MVIYMELKKIKRINRKTTLIIVIIILLGIYQLFSNGVFSCSIETDDSTLSKVEYKAILLDEPETRNSLLVTERLSYESGVGNDGNNLATLRRELPNNFIDNVTIFYYKNYVKKIGNGTEKLCTKIKAAWNCSSQSDEYIENSSLEIENNQAVINIITDKHDLEDYVYEVEYTVRNVASRYNDASELYLSIFKGDGISSDIYYLDYLSVEILIANKDMPKKGNYIYHTYGSDCFIYDVAESDTKNPGYHTFFFEADEDTMNFNILKEHPHISFSLLAFNSDKSIFTENLHSYDIKKTDYLDIALNRINTHKNLVKDYNFEASIKDYVLMVSIVISLIVLFFVFKWDNKARKKCNIKRKNTDIQYYRDIPSDLDPYFAANLVFIKEKEKPDIKNIYGAMLLNLEKKGYIDLQKIKNDEESDQNNIILKSLYIPNSKTNKNGKQLECLSPNEKRYLNLIIKYIGDDDYITFNDFQDCFLIDESAVSKFNKKLKDSVVEIGIKQNYFNDEKYDAFKTKGLLLSKRFLAIAIILLFLSSFTLNDIKIYVFKTSFYVVLITLIMCSIYLNICSKKYISLTEFGKEEYAKWRALYNFINEGTLLKEKELLDATLWEQYLVYATAFGISEKVSDSLELFDQDNIKNPILFDILYRQQLYTDLYDLPENCPQKRLLKSKYGLFSEFEEDNEINEKKE